MPRSVNGLSLGVWRERFAMPENATRTAKELGARFGVHASTVHYWRRRVADAERLQTASSKGSPNFVPVMVKSIGDSDRVIVRLPGEVSITVPCEATNALITLLNQLLHQGA